jgi:hypothetical protein
MRCFSPVHAKPAVREYAQLISVIRQFKNPLPSSPIALPPYHPLYLRHMNGFHRGKSLMGVVTHLTRPSV